MNLTEAAIATAIILAISGSTIWIGSKVMDQVQSQSAFIEVAADPAMSADQLEAAAVMSDEERQKIVAQYASVEQ